MNFRKVILIYLVVFAWFVVYHLVLGQDEITYYTGPRVLIGPPAPVYNQPLGFNGSGNSGDLVGIGIAGYLVYTRKAIVCHWVSYIHAYNTDRQLA